MKDLRDHEIRRIDVRYSVSAAGVLNSFVEADFTAALGISKLITSVTMTVFYLLLYYVWKELRRTAGVKPADFKNFYGRYDGFMTP